MKLFLDSADIEEIKQFYDLGIANGVTTNPSLMKKAAAKYRQDLKSYILNICKLAKGTPVSLEVTRRSVDEMVMEGESLYRMFNRYKNVYIKIPINSAFDSKERLQWDGLRAIRRLSKKKIPINCTLIFTPEQALLAAKAGARFVSPFAGRVDDFLRKNESMRFDKKSYFPAVGMVKKSKLCEDKGIVSGVDLVAQCVEILKHTEAEVLAASVRNARQVREVAMAGANIVTLPFAVLKEMIEHPKTYEGMKKFTADVIPEYAKLTKFR